MLDGAIFEIHPAVDRLVLRTLRALAGVPKAAILGEAAERSPRGHREFDPKIPVDRGATAP